MHCHPGRLTSITQFVLAPSHVFVNIHYDLYSRQRSLKIFHFFQFRFMSHMKTSITAFMKVLKVKANVAIGELFRNRGQGFKSYSRSFIILLIDIAAYLFACKLCKMKSIKRQCPYYTYNNWHNFDFDDRFHPLKVKRQKKNSFKNCLDNNDLLLISGSFLFENSIIKKVCLWKSRD